MRRADSGALMDWTFCAWISLLAMLVLIRMDLLSMQKMLNSLNVSGAPMSKKDIVADYYEKGIE